MPCRCSLNRPPGQACGTGHSGQAGAACRSAQARPAARPRNGGAAAAARAVPAGRKGRLREPAGGCATVGGRQGGERQGAGADAEEAGRDRGQDQGAAGEPAEAADRRQRDERPGARDARKGHRPSDARARAPAAGRAGRAERAPAGAAGRVPEEAVSRAAAALEGEGAAPPAQRRRRDGDLGRRGLDLTLEAVKKLDAAQAVSLDDAAECRMPDARRFGNLHSALNISSCD